MILPRGLFCYPLVSNGLLSIVINKKIIYTLNKTQIWTYTQNCSPARPRPLTLPSPGNQERQPGETASPARRGSQPRPARQPGPPGEAARPARRGSQAWPGEAAGRDSQPRSTVSQPGEAAGHSPATTQWKFSIYILIFSQFLFFNMLIFSTYYYRPLY
jgi:hypothetical protein